MGRLVEEDFITLLRQEVKPALGCTEPMAVAMAVARCCEELRSLGCEVDRIEIEVSRNILKNAMGVGIPGTRMVGLDVAVAMAVACGRSAYGLEVLRDAGEGSVEAAESILKGDMISVRLAENDKTLYIKVFAASGDKSASVTIEDFHDNVTEVKVCGRVVEQRGQGSGSSLECSTVVESDFRPSVREIFDFVTTVDLKHIEFMEEAAELNGRISREGIEGEYGLQVGRTIYSMMGSDVFGDGLLSRAMAMTAAASDARMAGSKMVVMSNSGSGNQGITATMPVVAAAQSYGSSREELVRALTLSHLVAIHIKQNLGRLSALCGCVVASTGSSCGIVLLRGGGYVEVASAINNMVGNITGMVCDGAKVGCALKVASGVSAAVQSAVLALKGLSTTYKDGIIDRDLEQTLRNLSYIGTEGMRFTDKLMLDIMAGKSYE